MINPEFRLLNRIQGIPSTSGESVFQKQYNQVVSYEDSNTFKLPLLDYTLSRSSNANAVEYLSKSFQRNFTSLLNDLERNIPGAGMKD